MATVTLTQISNGQTGDATVVDNNFDALANALNGNIEEDNIKNGTVSAAKAKAEAWTAWSPTYGGAASLTFTGVTTAVARYIQYGKTVHYRIDATGTTGGVTSNYLTFTFPVTAKDTSGVFGNGLIIDDGGNARSAFCFGVSVTVGGVQRYDVANLSLGASKGFRISGTYEAA